MKSVAVFVVCVVMLYTACVDPNPLYELKVFNAGGGQGLVRLTSGGDEEFIDGVYARAFFREQKVRLRAAVHPEWAVGHDESDRFEFHWFRQSHNMADVYYEKSDIEFSVSREWRYVTAWFDWERFENPMVIDGETVMMIRANAQGQRAIQYAVNSETLSALPAANPDTDLRPYQQRMRVYAYQNFPLMVLTDVNAAAVYDLETQSLQRMHPVRGSRHVLSGAGELVVVTNHGDFSDYQSTVHVWTDDGTGYKSVEYPIGDVSSYRLYAAGDAERIYMRSESGVGDQLNMNFQVILPGETPAVRRVEDLPYVEFDGQSFVPEITAVSPDGMLLLAYLEIVADDSGDVGLLFRVVDGDRAYPHLADDAAIDELAPVRVETLHWIDNNSFMAEMKDDSGWRKYTYNSDDNTLQHEVDLAYSHDPESVEQGRPVFWYSALPAAGTEHPDLDWQLETRNAHGPTDVFLIRPDGSEDQITGGGV